MTLLRQHADLFGRPGEGAHRWRIPCIDIALVDTVATLIAAAVVAALFGWKFWIVAVALFVIGFVLHVLFGVRTKLAAPVVDWLS